MAKILDSTGRLRVSFSRRVVLYEDLSLLYHLKSSDLLSAHHELCASRIRVRPQREKSVQAICGLCSGSTLKKGMVVYAIETIYVDL